MITAYIIGSMRNPAIPKLGNSLRELGIDAFEDWYSPGSEADEKWQEYEKIRGRTYRQALDGYHAKHVFDFDVYHLNRAHFGILVLPAGKSAFAEMGYLIGRGKQCYALLNGEPERYDIMLRFATGFYDNVEDLLKTLRETYTCVST